MRRSLALASLFAALFAASVSHAEDERRAKVAVRIGTHVVTVGELEDRIAGIAPFQQMTFGASHDAIVKAYTDQVVVHDLLLTAGAEAKHLDRELPTSHQIERALSNASLRASHAGIPNATGIAAEDVQKYYDDNKSRFDSPQRVNLWRILCKTQSEADDVLAAAKKEPTIVKFNDLARDKSIDKATNLRGGNLGFLAPDGTSNEAGLKVDPAILRAVDSLKDGEFAPQPVPESGGFAVIWRRATVPASKRTIDEASAQIRTALFRERIESAEKKLIKELRDKNVRDVDYALLGQVELPPFDAGTVIPKKK